MPKLSLPADSVSSMVTITSIQPTGEGLLLSATGPLHGSITQEQNVSAPGYEGFLTLTVTLPDARLQGVPPHLTWNSGPFSELRAIPYLEGGTRGVKLKLVPRTAQVWLVTTQGNTLLVAPKPVPAPRRQGEGGLESQSRKSLYSGSVAFTGSGSSSSTTGSPTLHTGQGQLGFAQNLGAAGTLRGFVSTLSPHQGLSTPYGALALSGLHLGPVWSEWAAGDVQTGLGQVTGSSSLPETLLLRGGGVTLFFPGRFGLQLFGGRAAQSQYQRLPGQLSLVNDLSPDHLYGAQLTWISAKDWLELGAGFVRSLPHEAAAARQNNLFESAALNFTKSYRLRVTAEESRLGAGQPLAGGGRSSGYALTLEPTASSPSFDAGGYYRLLSSGFRPPFGSNVFADYRHSYNLYANYHPSWGLIASASGGQSRSYNYFDPTQAGTLSTFTSGSLGYAFSSHFSLSATASRSESKSDVGVLNPTDSTTHDAGLTAAFSLDRLYGDLALTRETTDDAFTPSLGLRSTRLDSDTTYLLTDSQSLEARLRYYDAKRPDGQRVNRYYDGQFQWQGRTAELGQWSVQAGYTVTPAGVAQYESKQLSAGLGYQSGRWLRYGQLGLSLAYYRLDITGQPSRRGVIAQVSLGGLFGWGQAPQPVSSLASRSLVLGQSFAQQLPVGLLEVTAFQDDNGDGKREKGEAGVPDLWVTVDGSPMQTGPKGELRLRLAPGRHEVALLPKGAVFQYVVERAEASVVLPPQGVSRVLLPLRPAGQLSGRLLFEGEGLGRGELEGIRLVVRGAGYERATTTGPGGLCAFGTLPAGEAEVSLDLSTVPAALHVEGPAHQTIRITQGGETTVHFTLRRATAKERILEGPTPKPDKED
ncbi:MAG: hypothetical protein ACP5VF_03695 [Acidobacteriota bacterium]